MESNSDKKGNSSNLEKGIQLVREGYLHQADICFDAEMTQSEQPNSDVFIHHGHLLNRLGRYEDAIDKFDSFLNKDPEDVSCLFGKGISNIGLLNLDDALSLFEEVMNECPSHADACFYAAIIYCDPFYPKFNLSRAKEWFEKYQDLREDFFNNNPDYFDQLGDDLSTEKLGENYDRIHNLYNLSDLFIIINQLLESDIGEQYNNFLENYNKLNFINEYSDELFNIFRLFDDDTPLFDKIESFNSNKSVKDELKNVGYDNSLIDDLFSKFNGLTVDDKETLIKIMDFFKNYDLSFKDLDDLIRKNILEGNESIDSFYKNLENSKKSFINANDRKLKRVKEENEELKNKIDELREKINSLVNPKIDKKWDLDHQIDILEKKKRELEEEKRELEEEKRELEEEKRELSNQINNIRIDKSDNESMDRISIFGDDFKKAISLNKISGINNEDYQKDLDVLVSKGDITREERIIFESAFDEYKAGKFNEALEHFNSFSSKYNFLPEYINFLKVTALSSDNKIEEAYTRFLGNYSKNKLRDKYNKDKYPILWFNFGNIYFDYANSISGNEAIDAFSFSSYCYNNAIEIVSEKKSKSESKSNYKFNFKDERSKEDFEIKVQLMSKRVTICKNLLEIEKLKHYEMSKDDFENKVQLMSNRVNIFKKLYENEKNLLEIEKLKDKR